MYIEYYHNAPLMASITVDLYGAMFLYSLYKNGTERTCRTYILASTAAHTTLGIHHRYFNSRLLLAIYHCDGTVGTMTGTVATRHPITRSNAVLCHPHCCAHLYGTLHFTGNRFYGTGGAYLRADVTGRTAETPFK